MTEPGDRRPRLVIVCGAPGAGKTTLARALGDRLSLPVLLRDELKETLYDTLGVPDAAGSRRYGAASFELLYLLMRRLLEGGAGAVAETNFGRGSAEAQMRPLTEMARTVMVHCATRSAEETVRRYEERAARGERHPGHHDASAVGRLRDGLATGLYEPMDIPARVIRVDTTSGYRPTLEEVVAIIRR